MVYKASIYNNGEKKIYSKSTPIPLGKNDVSIEWASGTQIMNEAQHCLNNSFM